MEGVRVWRHKEMQNEKSNGVRQIYGKQTLHDINHFQFNSIFQFSLSIQFICIAQFHKLQICLGVLYNLYT